jgi:hypothetical protein
MDSSVLPICCPETSYQKYSWLKLPLGGWGARGGRAVKLTRKNIADLKLPLGNKDCVWFDDDISGFGIRIREGGSRTWIYRYRI